MAGWNGSGGFTFTYNWVNDAANGIPITASRMDTQFNDVISGFDNTLTRDNQGKPSATFIPDTNNAYDLGSSTFKWRDIYLSGTITVNDGAFGGDVTVAGALTTQSDITCANGSIHSGNNLTCTGFGQLVTIKGLELDITAGGGAVQWDIVPRVNGVRLSDGATSWTSASDETLKQNLVPITGAVAKLQSWRSFIGEYTNDPGNRHPFLIAQDIQKTTPEAVKADKDGKLYLSYTETIPDIVAAINEIASRLAAVEAK